MHKIRIIVGTECQSILHVLPTENNQYDYTPKDSVRRAKGTIKAALLSGVFESGAGMDGAVSFIRETGSEKLDFLEKKRTFADVQNHMREDELRIDIITRRCKDCTKERHECLETTVMTLDKIVAEYGAQKLSGGYGNGICYNGQCYDQLEKRKWAR